MTINIALATYDGIILGCDSLSSVVDNVIFPFRDDIEFAKDKDGNPILDSSGMPLISVHGPHIVSVATTVFGGVNKIFCLYQDDDTCVAAVTAGMATIGEVTIAEHAKRFKRKTVLEETKYVSVDEVAKDFCVFMRAIWLDEFKDTPDDQRHYLPTIQFIVSGFGANDGYGKIFKMDIARDYCSEQFDEGSHMGICWAGQADYVERLIKGVDNQLQLRATKEMAEAISRQRATTIADISAGLAAAQVDLPTDLDFEITEHTPPTLQWDSARADIDYGNLSTQYAVDLVEMLVNTQSGMQRFARGIPTVGGRTHIGVLKRGEGFKLLNAPELEHKHVGYGNDF